MQGLSELAASLLDFTDSISNSFGCQLTFWYRFACSCISQQLHPSSLPSLKAFSLSFFHTLPSSLFSFTNAFSLSCSVSSFSLCLHFKRLSLRPCPFAVSIDTQPVGFAQPTERLSFRDRLDLGQIYRDSNVLYSWAVCLVTVYCMSPLFNFLILHWEMCCYIHAWSCVGITIINFSWTCTD